MRVCIVVDSMCVCVYDKYQPVLNEHLIANRYILFSPFPYDAHLSGPLLAASCKPVLLTDIRLEPEQLINSIDIQLAVQISIVE